VLALLTTAFLGAVAGGLVLLTSGELLVAANYRDAVEAEAAAGAALDLAAAELQRVADWNRALSAAIRAGFYDPSGSPVLADGTLIDVAAATAALQATSAAGPSWGADSPRWSLFLTGHVSRLVPGGGPAGDFYLLAWVADDGGDGDGNPTADSNGIVQIRAEALGGGGRRCALRGVFGRVEDAPAPLRRLAWRHES
jgi:hypothetical protein